jgi:hypothetical protein
LWGEGIRGEERIRGGERRRKGEEVVWREEANVRKGEEKR